MPLFSEQDVFCRDCGVRFKTRFQIWSGEVCSRRCFKHLEHKRTLSNLGLPYTPPSEAVEKEWEE